MASEKKPEFSESDRAQLEGLLKNAAFEKWLEERGTKRREAIRAWVTWVSSILLLLNLIKDWLKSAWQSLINFIGP